MNGRAPPAQTGAALSPHRSFLTSLSLKEIFTDNHTENTLFPFWYIAYVVTGLASSIFLLQARRTWCRIQPIVTLFLLLWALLAKSQYHAKPKANVNGAIESDKRSAYESIARISIRPHFYLLLVATSAWISYGSLFHEGRHAAADLAVLDGLLHRDDIGSAFLISGLRILSFIVFTCISSNPVLFIRVAQNISVTSPFYMWVFGSSYVLLMAVPPSSGVPQAIGVGDSAFRILNMLFLFVANEFWRACAENYVFVSRVYSNSVHPGDFQNLRVNAIGTQDRTPIPLIRTTIFNSDQSSQSEELEALENFPLSLEIVSLLRSAWLLTMPNNFIAFVSCMFCSAWIFQHTCKWSRISASRVRLYHSTAKQSVAPPPPPMPSTAQPKKPPAVNLNGALGASTLTNRRTSPETISQYARTQAEPPVPAKLTREEQEGIDFINSILAKKT